MIGCDGANSKVKQLLGNNAVNKEYNCAAVRVYAEGVEGIKPMTNEFHFFKNIPGYFWIFPLSNQSANIGFGMLKHNENEKPINLRETLKKITSEEPSIANRFIKAKFTREIKGFALPLAIHKKPISGHRFMLCGDAASLIDSLQDHGIDKAMRSGIIAVEQAIDCFKSSNFSANYLKQYDKKLYKKIGFELFRSTLIMRLFIRFPSLLN